MESAEIVRRFLTFFEQQGHAIVPSARLGGALVTQSGKWAQALGRVDLTLTRGSANERWKLASSTAQVIAVTDSIPRSPR